MGQRTKRKRRRQSKGPRPQKPPRPAKARSPQSTREAPWPAPTARPAEQPQHPTDGEAAHRFAEWIEAAEVLGGAALLDLALGACASTFHLATRDPRCAALLEAVAEDLQDARYSGGYVLDSDSDRLRRAITELEALLDHATPTDVVLAGGATLHAGRAALAVTDGDLAQALRHTVIALQFARRALPERELPALLQAVFELVTETALAGGVSVSVGFDPDAACPCCAAEGMHTLPLDR